MNLNNPDTGRKSIALVITTVVLIFTFLWSQLIGAIELQANSQTEPIKPQKFSLQTYRKHSQKISVGLRENLLIFQILSHF